LKLNDWKKRTNIAELFTGKKVDKRHLFFNHSLEKIGQTSPFSKNLYWKKVEVLRDIKKIPQKPAHDTCRRPAK